MSSSGSNGAENTTAGGHPVFDAIARDAGPDAALAFVTLVGQYLTSAAAREGAVSTARTPDELAARVAEPLPREGRPRPDVLARVARDVVPDCNRLMDPRYMGHQVSAPVPAAIWTEALTAALNQSGAVWEMSPAGTAIEARVIRWFADCAGYGPEAGGAFTSGGTEATFAGLLAARHAACPDAWTAGLGADAPVVVCGEHAHYGVARAVGELGLGTSRLVSVPSRDFRLDVEALAGTLRSLRDSDTRIMAVVATAGSTATGTFDDLDAVASQCEADGLWLHVDGAHGASALLSARHRHRLAGVARARTLAWDPHKMMLMPLSASVVLAQDERDLDAAFSQRAPYLFHDRDGARSWDQGVRTFQCSRRIDALKVWVALQRYGADGLGVLYDHLCERAQDLHGLIAASPDFEALHAPESNILCFRYRGLAATPESDLDELNLRLRTAFNRGGDGWITTTVLGGRRVLRVTLMNPATTVADVARMLDGLRALAGAGARQA